MIPSDQSDDDKSDGGLRIIEESPKQKRKSRKVEIKPEEKEMITNLGSELDASLEEKATKTNLTDSKVKNIIKQVITNEHVVEMIRQAESSDKSIKLNFEPKLTRAKAKELYPNQTINNWVSPKTPVSETQVLISTELPDDSDDDEYIPAEESEDDHELSFQSENEPLSVEAPSTPQSADCGTQTTLLEDGIFKVPPSRPKIEEEDANIARRTRSKLSLNDTPLEVIEESFIPPDITVDLYDMDCDDDDWANFLKQFTRPLDEVTKIQEDEDHDPEYNILADEEMGKVDREELRADRAVQVTRKELYDLIAEVVDCVDDFDFTNEQPITISEQVEEPQVYEVNKKENLDGDIIKAEIIVLNSYDPFEMEQKFLLQQQMCQHVQMLTQHFLITYQHPEFHCMSTRFKDFLLELNKYSVDKATSAYSSVNLQPALELIQRWEDKFKQNDEDVIGMKEHIDKTLSEMVKAKITKRNYTPTFPKYLMGIISTSPVFMFPEMLPQMPFKSTEANYPLSESELQLISLGLEQFVPFLKTDKMHLLTNGEVNLKHVAHYIVKYILPIRKDQTLYKYICAKKKTKDMNPIKYYFENQKAPGTSHYLIPLDDNQIQPPYKKDPSMLPTVWHNFINPCRSPPSKVKTKPVFTSNSVNKVTKPPLYNKHFQKRRVTKSKADNTLLKSNAGLQKKLVVDTNSGNDDGSTPVTPSKARKCLETHFLTEKSHKFSSINSLCDYKFNSDIFKKNLATTNEMSRNMPLLSTPLKRSLEKDDTEEENKLNAEEVKIDNCDNVNEDNVKVDIKIEKKFNGDGSEIKNETENNSLELQKSEKEKDNLDDINELVVASATINTSAKKKPNGYEKKKAKLRRDFLTNLHMLSPENEDIANEKTSRYIQAFYDKVQEQLELPDYYKFMEVLNDFDERFHNYQDLYKSVENIIGKKHPEIMDEFLQFFTTLQAKSMGKLIPCLLMNSMSLFLRKLERFFKDQPSQVRKIYRAISDLAESENISLPQIKNTILPLLKGNGLLIDWFLQIFPTEKPPERLFQNWETIELGKEDTFNEDSIYETVIIPDTEDPYGGPACICCCHQAEDFPYKNRMRHCVPCGTKYYQGRIFVQTAKGLRLARISFDGDKNEHVKRLSCKSPKKKSESAKQISPGKESQDENKIGSSDDEPEKKHQKISKGSKKKKPRKKSQETNVGVNKAPGKTKKKCVSSVKKEKKPAESLEKKEVLDQNNESDSSITEVKAAVEENIEWDCNTSIESTELKLSSEHASADSEIELCEETSQDNTESDISGGEAEQLGNSSPSHIQWTREEDKIILETFQKEEDKEVAFKKVAEILQSRSISQIMQRFEILLTILKEMSNKR